MVLSWEGAVFTTNSLTLCRDCNVQRLSSALGVVSFIYMIYTLFHKNYMV